MRCPFCSTDDTRVLDSRDSNEGAVIRRRRECEACKRRFTTYERHGGPGLKVEKRDGSIEAFEHGKLLTSLERVSRGRPVRPETLDAFIRAMNEVLGADADPPPAATFVGVAALAYPDMLVEIDVIAVI